MYKADFLLWARKYDKGLGWRLNKEQELSSRFRRTNVLSLEDLQQVVEWYFYDNPNKKQRVLELVAHNDPEKVLRISSQVFSLPNADDGYRINSLMFIEGVTPVIASVILMFFDPKQYGSFDAGVWKYFLGNVPSNLYTAQNYLTLLNSLRKSASKHNLDVRLIDKALSKKTQEEAKPEKKSRSPKPRR